ncbi:lipoprotein [Spiroplasma endosymbiont of Seladonia tumulorum]|uniref:lipoprotein n=1 Tax=Spiroplasma endosymbiont of Seladonia tumulorum TaxID=3066321 RepID=UPI0030CFA2C5
MRKILNIIGAISLVVTSTTTLVSCNTPQEKEYTPEELKHLKKENQIDTTNETIKNNLEWITSQEKPFNPTGDYKYYIIIWRGDENDNWTIKKYKNTYEEVGRIDTSYSGAALYRNSDDLVANKTREHATWITDNGTYFKAVYRWSLDIIPPDLIIDDYGNIKVKED